MTYQPACLFVNCGRQLGSERLKARHLVITMFAHVPAFDGCVNFAKQKDHLVILLTPSLFFQELADIWFNCGKRLMESKSFVKISLECFALAETFLPEPDMCLKANISYSRASAILSASLSSHYQLAINDARTYVEQFSSFEVRFKTATSLFKFW